MTEKQKFKVIRDSREQNGWTFGIGGSCAGMSVKGLPTGDYTIEGYETSFIIERKADTGEFAKNIIEHRFERELERLEKFEYPFMVLEFSLDDIIRFPVGSGIPKPVWPKLRVTGEFMLKRFLEYQMQYKTKIILAGSQGYRVAWSLFKRMIEHDS